MVMAIGAWIELVDETRCSRLVSLGSGWWDWYEGLFESREVNRP